MSDENLSAEEQAQFDEMRDADAGVPEPADSPAAATEAPSDTTETETEAPKQRTVPHQALHSEREQHKATRAELAAERQRMALLEERTNLLLQRWQQSQPQAPAPQAPAIPDMQADPAGHIVGRLATIEEQQATRLAQLEQFAKQQAEQNQQAQYVQAIQARAAAMETEFLAEKPDYHQAVEHLMQSRHKELALLGITDPAQRQAQIAQEAMGIAQRAINVGANPAEWLYGLAEQRGFKAKAQPAAAADNTPDPAAVEKLARVASGQEQSRSLTNARGSGPVPMTAQRLGEMSSAEFAKALEDPKNMALLGA